MVNLLLFVITLLVAFIVVRIGAVALHLTGLEWAIAKFQALSCFSGTGFTTRESELITRNPRRRRIATILMITGNVGIVTLIATFANTIRPRIATDRLVIPYLHLAVPSQLLPVINLLIIGLVVFGIYKLFTHTRFLKFSTEIIRKKIIKQETVTNIKLDELAISTGGYSVASVDIKNHSPILNKILSKVGFSKNDITLLAIERHQEIIPNPSHSMKILLNDRLICFGKMDIIKSVLT